LKANIKRRAGGRNANGQWYEKKKGLRESKRTDRRKMRLKSMYFWD
jgi:hypothetical protein